jgi:hypothetical protein
MPSRIIGFDNTNFDNLKKYSLDELDKRILARRDEVGSLEKQKSHANSDHSYWGFISDICELRIEIVLLCRERERRTNQK